MSAQLHYTQNGRGGTITYREESICIHFDWEFGGGNCVAIVFVPTEAQWEKTTGLSLAKRLPILEFVAQQVVRDQAPTCRYEISDPWIEILHR